MNCGDFFNSTEYWNLNFDMTHLSPRGSSISGKPSSQYFQKSENQFSGLAVADKIVKWYQRRRSIVFWLENIDTNEKQTKNFNYISKWASRPLRDLNDGPYTRPNHPLPTYPTNLFFVSPTSSVV